jgi:hypothetical protein
VLHVVLVSNLELGLVSLLCDTAVPQLQKFTSVPDVGGIVLTKEVPKFQHEGNTKRLKLDLTLCIREPEKLKVAAQLASFDANSGVKRLITPTRMRATADYASTRDKACFH